MRDWTGNRTTSIVTTGGHNFSKHERETNDFYATDPKAIDMLLRYEKFDKNIWECACGKGHLSKRLTFHGHNVKSSDLIDRGFGEPGVDFLKCTDKFDGDILTNPPYRYADDFVLKGLELAKHKLALFLRIQYLEGKARYNNIYSKTPPKRIYVFSSRIGCHINGIKNQHSTSAIAYAWFIWEVGNYGSTEVK